MPVSRRPLSRFYALLLHLYPVEHRRAWGPGMQTTFEMRARELSGAGLARRGRFALKELGAVVATALAERLPFVQRSGFRQTPSGARRPTPTRPPRREIMSNLSFDIRLALRGWRRNPGTTALIVATLAVGIGATTAIFSVVDGVVLQPLPFPEAERLVELGEILPDGEPFTLSMPDFIDFRERAGTLEHVAVVDGASLALTGLGDPERVTASAVSPGFFAMLGLDMSLGRPFSAADEAEGGPLVVVLGHGFWRDRHGGDPDVLGQTLRLDGREHTIVGVAPPGIGFDDEEPQLWLPFRLTQEGRENRGGHMYEVVARLAPEVSLEAAREEVAAIGRDIVAATPEYHDARGSATLTPLKETIVGDVDRPLFLLLGAVCMLLLIACVNVASIMLARAESRGREVAVRAALGAGTARLVRPLLADSLLLAGAGGLAGIALAHFGGRAIVATLASNLPRASGIGIDPGVLGFALATTTGAGLLVGLLPLWHALRTDTYAAMRSGSGQQAGDRRSTALRRSLIVAEIGIAVTLALGAGLLVQSLLKLQGVERGFVADRALTFRVSLPQSRYPTMEAAGTLIHGLEAELERLPGVEGAGAIGLLPFFAYQYTGVAIAGQESDLAEDGQFRYATPGYFDAIGTPLVRGRVFSERDTPDAPPVIVLSLTLARRLFDEEDPIGQRVYIPGWGGPQAIEVVGVVEDVKLSGLREPAPPTMYWPYAQWNWRSSMSFVVRTAGDPADLTASIRQAVGRLDPELPIYAVELLADRTRRSVAQERLTTTLLSGFAGIALLLGAVGIFGVMAYGVVQRRREIGVRVALGATPRNVVRGVLGEGAMLVGGGLLLGALGAFALGRTFRSLLYETSPTDPATFAAVAALLTAVALLACLLPARRAARVDPMVVLRSD
jgi:predicted permease